MFDASLEFEKFIKERIVLPLKDQQKLRKNKDINIERLKEGLLIYNQEHKTSFKIADTCVQGSMSMNTVIQNDSHDYDIDVAIIFDDFNIDSLTAYQARKMVCDALTYKTTQFKVSPELKTNCIRISYADGYHIDFAVYKRTKKPYSLNYLYQHSGGFEWTERDPEAITAWFQKSVKDKGLNLRKVVRLLKTFCKSREGWVNMPGGLLQSVICDESIYTFEGRVDEVFYNTISYINKRLKLYTDAYNPTNKSISLLTAQNHHQKMSNLQTRLEEKMIKLNVLFNPNCTKKEAYQAWFDFFNNDYWSDLITSLNESMVFHSFGKDSRAVFADTEEEIIDYVKRINLKYEASIEAKVESMGFSQQPLGLFLSRFPIFRKLIPQGMKLDFYATTNAPKPYDIYWKIRNVGAVAEKRNEIRGQILKGYGSHKRENSSFFGPHYVECYIVKDGECVAQAHIDVNIGEKTI